MFRMLGFHSPGWWRWPASSASEETPLSCPDSKSPPDNPGQAQSRSGLCLFQIMDEVTQVQFRSYPNPKINPAQNPFCSLLVDIRLNSSLSPSHPTCNKVLSWVLWYVVSLDQTKMSIRFPKIFLLLHNVSETDQYKIRSLSAQEKSWSLSKSIMSQGQHLDFLIKNIHVSSSIWG